MLLPLDYYWVANILGFTSLLLAAGYGMQSAFYVTYIINSVKPMSPGKRSFSFGLGMKKAVQICAECTKTTLQLGFGLEMGYKLTHGGLNDISPVRQYFINTNVFPEKPDRIWTEASLGYEVQKRALESIAPEK